MIVSRLHDSTCRVCGRPTERQQLLSRHTTSEGIVSWVRCACGALEARFRPHGSSERVVAASRPHGDDRPGWRG